MGRIADYIQSNPYLCPLAGLVRRGIWYFTGWMGPPGAHAVLLDQESGKVLTVLPTSEQLVSFLTGGPVLHLPGGEIEPGETPQQAAERECREELQREVDLSAAHSEQIVVRYGKLRMRVTMFLLPVNMNEFTLPGTHPAELLAPPSWEDPERIHARGTPGARGVLEQLHPIYRGS